MNESIESNGKTNAEVASLTQALLDQIAHGSALGAAVEQALRNTPPPGAATLIQLHRSMIMNHAARLEEDEEKSDRRTDAINTMMRTILEWAKVELKREQGMRDERRVAILEEKARKFDEAHQFAKEESNLPPAEQVRRYKEILGMRQD